MFASQQLAGHNIFPTWNMRQPMSPTTQHVISYEKKTYLQQKSCYNRNVNPDVGYLVIMLVHVSKSNS